MTGSLAGTGGAGVGIFGFPGKPGNAGIAGGGAVYNEAGAVQLVNSTFLSNSSAGFAGGAGAGGNDSAAQANGAKGG